MIPIKNMKVILNNSSRGADEKLHWRLELGSKLTIVSLLCLTIVLYTIYYLNNRPSAVGINRTNIIHMKMTTSV